MLKKKYPDRSGQVPNNFWKFLLNNGNRGRFCVSNLFKFTLNKKRLPNMTR